MKCLTFYIKRKIYKPVLVVLMTIPFVLFVGNRAVGASQLVNKPLTEKIGVYAGTLNDVVSKSDKKETLVQYKKAKGLGFSYVRIPFRINPDLTSLTGKYDFSKLDYAIKLTKKVGLTPIVYFVSGSHDPESNTWSKLYPELTYSDTLVETFTSVAVKAVKRYAGKGVVWEGWNEPNGSYWFSQNGLRTVKDWVGFDKTIAETVKKYDKKSIFLTGAFSGTTTKSNDVFVHARNNGLTQNASAVSNHPYQTGLPEDLLTNNKEYADVNMPTVTTEIGYTTKQSWQGKSSYAKQAKYDARSMFILDMMKQPLIVLFNLKDSSDTGWGLETTRNKDKKSAQLISYLLYEIKGYQYVKRIDMKQNGSEFALLYQKGKQYKVVYWSVKKSLIPVSYGESQFLLAAENFPQILTLKANIANHKFLNSNNSNPQNVLKFVDSSGKIIKSLNNYKKANTNVTLKKVMPTNYGNQSLFEYKRAYTAPDSNSVIIYQVYARHGTKVHTNSSWQNIWIVGIGILVILAFVLLFIRRKVVRAGKK